MCLQSLDPGEPLLLGPNANLAATVNAASEFFDQAKRFRIL
jgi:hypothetical protein